MQITTQAEFDAARREWDGCEFALSGGTLSQADGQRAVAKQIEIERAIDASPFGIDADFDEDGNLIAKLNQSPKPASA